MVCRGVCFIVGSLEGRGIIESEYLEVWRGTLVLFGPW